MRKIKYFLVAITMVFVLTGCGFLNWINGVDDKGNDLPGIPPISIFAETIKQMGPIGTAVAGLLTIGGTAYVSNRQSKGTLKGVIAGIQKAKDAMSEEDKDALVVKLKKHIPNKYHKAIGKIKDAL